MIYKLPQLYQKNVFVRFPINIIMSAILTFLIIPFAWNNTKQFYYENFDSTVYYEITDLSTDKLVYNKCDTMLYSITRDSIIDTEFRGSITLILQRADGTESNTPIKQINSGRITQGDGVTKIDHYDIPCDIESGDYFITALFHYEINGIVKEPTATSDTFKIK